MLGLFTAYVSNPYNNVDNITAQYAPLLICTLRLLLSKTKTTNNQML